MTLTAQPQAPALSLSRDGATPDDLFTPLVTDIVTRVVDSGEPVEVTLEVEAGGGREERTGLVTGLYGGNVHLQESGAANGPVALASVVRIDVHRPGQTRPSRSSRGTGGVITSDFATHIRSLLTGTGYFSATVTFRSGTLEQVVRGLVVDVHRGRVHIEEDSDSRPYAVPLADLINVRVR